MSPTGFTSALEEIEHIGLAELNAAAALDARTDRKYLVPDSVLEPLVRAMGPSLSTLAIDGLRAFAYETAYFDTPEYRSVLDAARRRPRRFKVRTRAYLDTGVCVLEVKARERTGTTVKHRVSHPLDLRSTLTPAAKRYLGSFDLVAPVVPALRPSMTTRYQRATLVALDQGSRITIDTGMSFTAPDGRSFAVPGLAVVETKTTGKACAVDRRLWEMHYRPAHMSKYCTSLAAIYPELPSNKWARILDRYFLPAVGRDGMTTGASVTERQVVSQILSAPELCVCPAASAQTT